MSTLNIDQLVTVLVQFLQPYAVDIDAAALANSLTLRAPQACPPPPASVVACTMAPTAAPQPTPTTSPDSDSMECSDTASVTSSSRKRTANTSLETSSSCSTDSSDSDGTVTGETPFTLVKSKRGSKRAAKRRPSPVPAVPAADSAPAAPVAAHSPAAPAAAHSSAAPAALLSLDIPRPSKTASRCAPTLAKKQVPPPVFLRDKAKFTRLSKICYDAGIKYDQATNLGESIKIVPQSIDDFRRITRLFTAEKANYFTYALPQELKVKAVIRGVPFELSNEDILEDLKSQGFPVEAVHKMHSNKGKRFPLALVILTNVPEAKTIFREVRTVCGLSRIRVEAPHRRGFPAQCHRCQLYGHAAANCSAPPRCVKCLDPHSSKECPRPRDSESPPECVLCGQAGHPASYRGCPRAPRPRPTKPVPPPFNDRAFPALPNKMPQQGPSQLSQAPSKPQPSQAPSQPPQALYRPPQAPYRPPQALYRPPQGPPRPPQGLSQPPPPTANPWGPKAAAPPRTPAAPHQAQSSLADDLKTVYSVIRNVDIGEIAVLARKLRAAQSPQDRLLALAEHHNLLCSL